MAPTATPAVAARAPLHLPSIQEAPKAGRGITGSEASTSLLMPPQAPAQSATRPTTQSSLTTAPAQAQEPESTPESASEQAPAPAIAPAPSPVPVTPPPQPTLAPVPVPAQAPPPVSVPVPAPAPAPTTATATAPAPLPLLLPPNSRILKVFLKRALPNPSLAAIRPTMKAWSPLVRLLSQHKVFPPVALTQVLGKRARDDNQEGEGGKKKPRLEGEFQFLVGRKRKRDDEELPDKRRAMLSRNMAVPHSRFAAGESLTSANGVAPTPTLAPSSILPNGPLTPGASKPSGSLSPALESLPANPHSGLAEAIEFYKDLPTLRGGIAWMRSQHQIATSCKEAPGKKAPINKKNTKHTTTQASYWSKYREKLSR